MKIYNKLNPCGWFLLAAVICSLQNSSGQSITGNLQNVYTHTRYANIESSFRISNLTVGGSPIYGGFANILCSDYEGKSIDEDSKVYPREVTLQLGDIQDLDIWDRYTTTQNESLAVAQVRWLIDNRYDSYFLNPEGDTSAKQYALQNVIWEIMADGGTAAGLDFATGDIDRTIYSNTRRYGSSLWSNMNQLLNDVKNSGVTESYVGNTRIFAALDSRAGYQDYLFLSNEVNTVPEPSGVALLGLGGIVMLLRRRR